MLEKAADFGHNEAKRKVAWACMFGKFLKQNLTKAEEIFEELSSKGDPEGQMVCIVCILVLKCWLHFMF